LRCPKELKVSLRAEVANPQHITKNPAERAEIGEPRGAYYSTPAIVPPTLATKSLKTKLRGTQTVFQQINVRRPQSRVSTPWWSTANVRTCVDINCFVSIFRIGPDGRRKWDGIRFVIMLVMYGMGGWGGRLMCSRDPEGTKRLKREKLMPMGSQDESYLESLRRDRENSLDKRICTSTVDRGIQISDRRMELAEVVAEDSAEIDARLLEAMALDPITITDYEMDVTQAVNSMAINDAVKALDSEVMDHERENIPPKRKPSAKRPLPTCQYDNNAPEAIRKRRRDAASICDESGVPAGDLRHMMKDKGCSNATLGGYTLGSN
jgi:hypothetical protein